MENTQISDKELKENKKFIDKYGMWIFVAIIIGSVFVLKMLLDLIQK